MSATAWLIEDDRVRPLPAGWDPLTLNRVDESWDWRVLDRNGRFLGMLDGVEGGSLDLNIHTDIRGQGRLSWSGRASDMPVWRETRVQPVHTATLKGGSKVRWAQGTFMCASPAKTHTYGQVSTDVSLWDMTLVLQRAKLRKPSGVMAGTQVIPHIRSILAVHGVTRHVLQDSTETLRTTLVWEADTSWLRIINDLLDAIGYFSIWADVNGVLRASKYTEPKTRPERWLFTDTNTKGVHEEELDHNEDDFDVPNRVTVISRGDGYTFELVATRSLDQIIPGHPWSFAKTGQWIDRVEQGYDATSQSVLDAAAERLLRAGLAVASTGSVTHAPLPLALHDRISINSTGLVIPSATIQNIGIECKPGADWTLGWRQVAA